MRSWFRLYLTAGLAIIILGVALTTVSVTGRHDTQVVATKRVPVPRSAASGPAPATAPTAEASAPDAPASAPANAVPAATSIEVVGTPSPVTDGTDTAARGAPAATSDGLTPSAIVALSCPLPLAPSTVPGGLASLTTVLPLFGPFSAEAFAAVPLFQPFFPLVAPLLNLLQRLLAPMQPLIDGAVPIVQLVENAGYETLLPAYGPFRAGFLDFAKSLANSLQPLVQQVAAVPGSGCLPALQNALLSIAAQP
jgi:hypothetical protein